MAEPQDKFPSRAPASGVAGRELPHSLEAEEYLLSCCFIDGTDTVARCLEDKLAPKAFFSPANQIIYEKLLDLYQRNLPIDTAIVAEELKAGGPIPSGPDIDPSRLRPVS